MNCTEKLQAYLRENGVPFELQTHPRVYTAQEVAAVEHIPGEMLAKVVMVLADGKLVMLTLPATHRVDTDKVAAMLNAEEVRLAQERDFANVFPDCEVGAMPPFGNLYGVPVYVDETLAKDETIVFAAGTHTETMSIKYADFARLAKPQVGSFARQRMLF